MGCIGYMGDVAQSSSGILYTIHSHPGVYYTVYNHPEVKYTL